MDHVPDAARRALVEKFLALYEAEVVPVSGRLRRSVIYGDANDYNVLVSEALPLPRNIVGVIDFGDMHHSFTVAEMADWRCLCHARQKGTAGGRSRGDRRLSRRVSTEEPELGSCLR